MKLSKLCYIKLNGRRLKVNYENKRYKTYEEFVFFDASGCDCHGNHVCNPTLGTPIKYDDKGNPVIFELKFVFSSMIEDLNKVKESFLNWINSVVNIAPKSGIIRWILASYRSKRRRREESGNVSFINASCVCGGDV